MSVSKNHPVAILFYNTVAPLLGLLGSYRARTLTVFQQSTARTLY